MSVTYIGTDKAFEAAVGDVLTKNWAPDAASTGKFRNADAFNRNRYPLTASLLDRMAAPYSVKLRNFHYRVLLKYTRLGMPLDTSDKDGEYV